MLVASWLLYSRCSRRATGCSGALWATGEGALEWRLALRVLTSCEAGSSLDIARWAARPHIRPSAQVCNM